MSSLLLSLVASLAVAAPSADAITATAMDYLGRPYTYGASDGVGYDCSSFVRSVYGEHDIALPRTSRDQAHFGEAVAPDAIAAADLLFFSAEPGGHAITHVGLALDHERMIHASSGRGEIVIDVFATSYFRERLVAARRILGVVAPAPERAAKNVLAVPLARRGTTPFATVAGALPGDAPGASELGVESGYADVADRGLWIVGPRWSLVARQPAVWLRLQLPVAFDVASRALAWRYQRPSDYLRLVDVVALGRPTDALHVALSRDLALTLGEGVLVRESTPGVASYGPPGLPTSRLVALSLGARLGRERLRLVLDDVIAPRVVGVRLEDGRRVRRSLEVAFDPRLATEARTGSAVSGGVRLPLWLGERLDVVVDAALAAEMVGRPALGGVGGAELAWRSSRIELDADVRGAYHDVAFVPGLFGYDYRLLVSDGRDATPLWEGLRSLGDRPVRLAWSQAWRLRLRVHDGPGVALAYDAGPARPGVLPRRRLAATVDLGELSFAGGRFSLGAQLAYHQRFEAAPLAPLSAAADEVVFAGARMRAGAYGSVGIQVAKRTDAQRRGTEALLELGLGLPFQ